METIIAATLIAAVIITAIVTRSIERKKRRSHWSNSAATLARAQRRR